jgi:hypothetical protein
MTRITVTFDADLTDQRNTYIGGGPKNLGEAVDLGQLERGQGVYIEFGSGDMAHGRLVGIIVDRSGEEGA